MKQLLKKGMILLLAAGVVLGMSVSAYAGEPMTIGERRIGGNYIEISTPKDNAVYYQGENIDYFFTSYDTWTYYYSKPAVIIMNEDTEKNYYIYQHGVVTPDSYDYYSGSVNTKKWPAGNYSFGVMHFAYKYRSDTHFTDLGNEPLVVRNFTLKKLRAPSSVRATAGSGKIRVSYPKAAGAQKYYIYRSTSPNGTYKKIGQSKTLSYIDKSVKKGKKYFYKVRSVRTSNGTIASAYSKMAVSGKVK